MRRRHPQPGSSVNVDHLAQRQTLRGLGWTLVVLGGLFTLVGLGDFFASFNSTEMPTMFWMAMIGVPMLGGGTWLLKAGYLGTISRYVAGETLPVASDAIDELARSSTVAGAVTSRLAGTATEPRCESCGRTSDTGSRFCQHCGTTLPSADCAGCGARLDLEDSFCGQCGQPRP